MKLDPSSFRYLGKQEMRALTAVEMGMKNHELVPVPLIEKIANINRRSVNNLIKILLRYKLVAHDGKRYDGYKLTYLGYDFLALRTFVERGVISAVGMQIGVGKESDIHICKDSNDRTVILKLHRLGRISFRSIKRNRDYLKKRQSASWLYLARLSALKEYAFMRALFDHGFPVPEPIEQNRHAIVMSYVEGTPLHHIKNLHDPGAVLDTMMSSISRLARVGLIHGDFNEFNVMLGKDEQVTIIDFPQMITTKHENAKMYFDRDVECVKNWFARNFRVEVMESPIFETVIEDESSLPIQMLDQDADKLVLEAHQRVKEDDVSDSGSGESASETEDESEHEES